MRHMTAGFLEAIGRGSVIVVVIAAMAGFRKFVTARSSGSNDERLDSEDLEERFMPLRGRVIGGMIAVGGLFAIASWCTLSKTNIWLSRLDGPADFVFLPQTAIWWFFPAFGALSLSWELTLQAWALFGDRKTVNLFSDWTNQSPTFWGASYGMDSRRVLRWMSLVVLLPIFVFTALALNMHATITRQRIQDCGYAFKPCSVYRMADLRRVTQIDGFQTRDGKITHRAGLVFDFADGRRWSTADWGNFKKSVDPAFLNYINEITHLPIGKVSTDQDIPALESGADR
ncbi:MAG: hypothetical protein JST28_20670 [Acidobacteria bacterium]|nr:hypothetical protein [Acidobacteriota bacterium]